MNQYDPMKGNASNSDQNNHAERQDTYNTADHGYTYGTASDNGQGYTNPDGSHGFIYNPTGGDDRAGRNRSYRGAVIALASVMATLFVGGCCFFGAYMAAKSLQGNPDGGTPPPTETEAETSGGLFIRDDDTKAEDTEDLTLPILPDIGKNPEDTQGGASSADSEAADSEASADDSQQMGSVDPPAVSIQKLPPEREDLNGDGKAEIETDESGEVLTSAGGDTLSVATVVSRVAASVVEITTETLVQSGHIGQYIASGAGSGVIISGDGYIVTNHHVIDGANSITVRLNSGEEFSATLVGTDSQTDIAVLKIDPGAHTLTVATLGASFDLVVGEDILAIGNPLGSLGGTVTEGMISATAREISVSGVDMTLLQVSAPINPGNSGGGLFNLAGELVGVVNAKVSSEEIEGLGFAIPVDTAYEVILELLQYGYVRGRPAIDFNVVDVTSMSTAMYYFNSFNLGVYVYDESHSTMLYGDLILAADGTKISAVSDLERVIRGKQVGDTLELTIYRGNREKTVTVTIVESVPELKSKS